MNVASLSFTPKCVPKTEGLAGSSRKEQANQSLKDEASRVLPQDSIGTPPLKKGKTEQDKSYAFVPQFEKPVAYYPQNSYNEYSSFHGQFQMMD